MTLTVLCKLCRACEGGDLEAVFGDGNDAGMMEGFSRLSLFLFHFSIQARQSQICLGVVSFLHIHLQKQKRNLQWHCILGLKRSSEKFEEICMKRLHVKMSFSSQKAFSKENTLLSFFHKRMHQINVKVTVKDVHNVTNHIK